MHQNSYSLSKDEFDLENENIRFLKKLKYSIKCESREKYKFTLQYFVYLIHSKHNLTLIGLM